MRIDNKGRDIFMGVIAIATLIVAIIGATLAYFSITVSSKEGAVNATATTVSINYEDGQQVTAQADELIPSSFSVMQTVYEKNVKDLEPVKDLATAGNTCVDDNNRQVCSAYRFSIKSDISRSISATLNNETNGFTYLSYALYNVTKGEWMQLTDETGVYTLPLNQCSNTDDDAEKPETLNNNCFQMNDTVKTYNTPAINSIFGLTTTDGKPTFKQETIATDKTQTYDLILFIEENNANQNIDQGKTFSGTIVVEVLEGTSNGIITGCVGDECKEK